MKLQSLITYFLAACFCSLLSSCSSNHGNAAIKDFGRYANLEKNKSNKMDVYKSFGQPHNVAHSNRISQWSYFNTQASVSGATFVPFVGLVAGGSNNKIFSADFFFNSKNILENYSTNEKGSYTNTWVGIGRGAASHLSDTQAQRVEREMQELGLPFDKAEAREAREMGAYGTPQR